MLFGKESLIIPEQAVFMNGKFFVADSGCGAVMVFDNNGDFCNAFGSEQLESPCGIAADYTNGTLWYATKKITPYTFTVRLAINCTASE